MKKLIVYSVALLFVIFVVSQFTGRRDTELPKHAADEPLDCSGEGYTSIYKPQTQYAPAMVWVTFRGSQPTRSVAVEAVSRCLRMATSRKQFKGDLMGMAWWSKTGNNNDDDTQELTNGSRSLIIKEGTTDIVPLK